MAVIGASQLSLHYAEMEIFSEVTLQVEEKARIGVVGPNGSGKTSLIQIQAVLEQAIQEEMYKQ